MRRLADFTDISAGRAPCDRWMMPELPLVLYMRRAQRRTAPTPSMLHRSGNSPLDPSEIFHRPTLAACSSRHGQAPPRDPGEPDCDRSEAQISRSPEGSRVAPIVLVAPLHRSLVRGRGEASAGYLSCFYWVAPPKLFPRRARSASVRALSKDPQVGEVSVGNWVTLEALRQMAIRSDAVTG